ncbi:SRPBCC family protein [Loktanella sp. Alg231-35]|uniref:SRPBCC family protein n=1 Tax=Loktanella sp. Alg231-35 TaxID=1922220 RepID=UPI000D5593A0|nr:SRPBCC family protein [Loktanella sp. Alg231-35]
MKLSTREDLEAPIDFVFARVTDFAAFERRALRNGAQVVRHDEGAAQVGTIWDVDFTFRGRDRCVQATLVQFDPPHALKVDSKSDGVIAVTEVELVALSPARTRVIVGFEMRARTLTARLLLQSLKLAKAKLTKRFKARVLDYAEDVEDQYRATR